MIQLYLRQMLCAYCKGCRICKFWLSLVPSCVQSHTVIAIVSFVGLITSYMVQPPVVQWINVYRNIYSGKWPQPHYENHRSIPFTTPQSCLQVTVSLGLHQADITIIILYYYTYYVENAVSGLRFVLIYIGSTQRLQGPYPPLVCIKCNHKNNPQSHICYRHRSCRCQKVQVYVTSYISQ